MEYMTKMLNQLIIPVELEYIIKNSILEQLNPSNYKLKYDLQSGSQFLSERNFKIKSLGAVQYRI